MKLTNSQILSLLVILLSFTSIVLGQATKKIFGRVFDSEENQALVGANIVIEGTSIGTSTDEFGYFQFDNLLIGTYTISVSYIGFSNKTSSNITVYRDQPTEINFYLIKTENTLDEIIVTSQQKNNISNVKIFTAEKINKSNSQSVAEILEQVPGLEIQSTGGVGSEKKISIRGSNTNQVLVLLDGIPLNNQTSGNANLSNIPTNIIKRIEVYEGGSSSKFGNGAIGGAINIITKKNFKNEYKLKFVGGSYNFLNIEPSIAGDYKNISYFLSYNLTQGKNNYSYNSQNTKGGNIIETRLNADIKSQNIFTRVNYKLDNYLFSVNAQLLESQRGIPGKIKAPTAYARSKNNSRILATSTKATFNKLIISLSGSYSKSESKNSNLYPDNAPQKYKRYSRYNYSYESNITILNSTVYYDPIKWLSITTGYNGKWLNYNDENFALTLNPLNNSAKDISHGLFLHQEYKIDLPKPFNKIIVSPSIRYDEMRMSSKNLKRFEHQWSPSFSLYTSFGKKYQLFIRSNISKSFRVPTFSDLFYQDVRIEGKADLLPEKSLNKEIGIGWEVNKCGKLRGEINYYNYSIDDMIVWKLGSFEIFRPFNDDADITGQDYSLYYQLPNKKLILQASYTYLQPLDKNNHQTTHNKIIPYRPQHSFKSSIQFDYKYFSSKINYRFVGQRFVTIANTVRLPSYQVVDLTLLQNIKFGGLKISLVFSINNLTNEFYEIIREYPIPGREFRLGITLLY